MPSTKLPDMYKNRNYRNLGIGRGKGQKVSHFRPNYHGLYLQHGNGCSVCEDCFKCPDEYANDCQYKEW